MKFKLKRPITTHAGEIAELEVREIGADIIFRLGPPFRTLIELGREGGAQRVEVRMEPQVFQKYLETATGLDAGVLGQLAAGDLQQIYNHFVAELNPAGA